ncbi:MAG: hypothetical protein NXI19_19905 [Alphaproteobacteria bacterium]|nr:hypothetical protein [Alphaproteobacteria bacterium]
MTGDKQLIRIAIALTFILALGACAGRPANPTLEIQQADANMSCPQLAVEVREQERQAALSYAADESQEEKNTAIGFAGVLLAWPLLFAFEPGDHNLVEAQAYESRAEHLRRIMTTKNCNLPNVVPASQPATEPVSKPIPLRAARPATEAPGSFLWVR